MEISLNKHIGEKIFIVYRDENYCECVDEFDTVEGAEVKLSELYEKVNVHSGVTINAVIKGFRLDYKAVKVVTKVKLKKMEDKKDE